MITRLTPILRYPPCAAIALLLFLSACEDSGSDATKPERTDIATNSPEVPRATVEDVSGWTTPESRWIANRRDRAMGALQQRNAQLMVTPVQGGRNAFDPIERYLITRLITNYVARGDDVSVLDSYWVTRFFGFHEARYQTADMLRLAQWSQAEEIVTLQVEHDNNGRFSLTATVRALPDMDELRTKTWTDLEFSDEAPPSIAVRRIIDDVAEAVTGKRYGSPQTAPAADFDPAELVFPQSIAELKAESDKSYLHEAAYLQLLAALHPSIPSNETRNELFARSLVILNEVSPASPYQRYLTARAYAYLDRRPAAIAALGQPRTHHDRALLALVNGDLPSLREATVSLGDTPIDFMALRDLKELERRYDKRVDRESDERFVEANPVWAPFLYRALRDTSEWGNYSALTIKLGLENLLPAETSSAQGAIDQALVIGESPDELELTRTLFQHLEMYDKDQLQAWSEEAAGYIGASEPDIIDLATELAVANHLRRNQDDMEIRVIPDAAVRRIREFESIFSGHPAVTLQLGRALEQMAKEATGNSERRNLREGAAEAYRNGFSWTGQLTTDAAYVAEEYRHYFRAYMPRERPMSPPNPDVYEQPLRYTEWPQGAAWFRYMSKWQVDGGLIDRCIEYSWTAFSCVTFKLQTSEDNPDWTDADRQALLASTAHRFIGNPQRSAFEIKLSKESDSEDAEIEQLRSRIDAGATEWGLYYALGREYKRRGDYRAAQEVWLSYPGFSKEDGSVNVGDSQNADAAGSMLYWIGQHELALPLLSLAANSGTGSGGSMSSGERVALINGDLETAAQWAAARIRRYQSNYAIRDMQQLLHLLGESELAWGLFDQALSVEEVPHIWSGPLVGHRLQNASIDDIAGWINQSEKRQAAQFFDSRTQTYIDLAQRYLLMAGTMDRVPDADFADKVSALSIGEQPVYHPAAKGVNYSSRGKIEWTGHVKSNRRVLTYDPLAHPPDYDPQFEEGQQVDSRYEMLADAMAAFLNGDFVSATRKFEAIAYLYQLDEYLPYYAYCAAETGRADHIPKLLESREVELGKIRRDEELDSSQLGYRFPEDLTYAVLAAYEGQHEAAISNLKAAMNNRPYLEDRSIYPYYEVVDLAERLFQRFEKDTYRDLALDLSRRHTIVLPMYAWAYAVVATHSTSEAERVRAIASAMYLDPQSVRLSRLPADLVEKAKNLLADSGPPFLRRQESGAKLET